MDGRQVLEQDPDLALKLATWQMRQAQRARSDLELFFEYVMVTDETKKRVKCTPHQRLILRFMRDHARGVVMIARGHSKTFCVVAMILYMMGHDPNFRGAIVSATQEQANKVLKAVREAIEGNARVHLVFPHLRRSLNKFDPWTSTSITVQRASGSRDPSLVSVGLDGVIRGSRLKAVFIDDILSDQNVNTEEMRQKTIQWVDAAVMGTLDLSGDTKAFIVGTSLHPRDILHVARDERKWATLRMDVTGNIQVQDDEDPGNRLSGGDTWDPGGLRESTIAAGDSETWRLSAHDPDPEEKKILFPERFGVDRDGVTPLSTEEALRRILMRVGNPLAFQREYMMLSVDEASAACKKEWIQKCLDKAMQMGVHELVDEYKGGGLVFTGVDLGLAVGEHNDDTSYFTALVHADGHRQILDIEYGKFDGAQKMHKVKEKHDRYGTSLIVVEGNAGQRMLGEWVLDQNISLPVTCIDTGREKADAHLGLPGLFMEIYNAAWIIPTRDGQMRNLDPRVERWVRECTSYVADRHTGDVLMSSWLAQKGMRKWGLATGAQMMGESDLGSFLTR